MQLDPHTPLTAADLRASTLMFSLLACLLSIPLILIQPQALFTQSWLLLVSASGLFWGSLSLLAFRFFWDTYYRYIYPPWLRRLAPLNILLYGLIALGMWLAVRRFSSSAVVLFLLVGGCEGILEHIIGVYSLHVLQKVPWLQGLPALPVLIFSFVEYIVYWGLVVWIAFGLQLLT